MRLHVAYFDQEQWTIVLDLTKECETTPVRNLTVKKYIQ